MNQLNMDIFYHILKFCTPATVCNIIASGARSHEKIAQFVGMFVSRTGEWCLLDDNLYQVMESMCSCPEDTDYIIEARGDICTGELLYKHTLRVKVLGPIHLNIGIDNCTQSYIFYREYANANDDNEIRQGNYKAFQRKVWDNTPLVFIKSDAGLEIYQNKQYEYLMQHNTNAFSNVIILSIDYEDTYILRVKALHIDY